MLCLHTSTNRAINNVRKTWQYPWGLFNFITSNYHSNYREYACHLLEAEHKSNNAVIAFCCLNIELILQHKTCAGNWICKAKENLSAETKFRAPTFSTSTTAWHISTTAHIPWHVIVKSSSPQHVWCTGGTERCKATIGTISRDGMHEICVPEITVVLPCRHLLQLLLRRHCRHRPQITLFTESKQTNPNQR